MSDDVEQRVVADPDLAPALEVHALPSAPAPVAADRVPVAGAPAKSRRRSRSEKETAYWRAVVEEWNALLDAARRAGGLLPSIRGFCRERTLREPSFYWWRREFAIRDGKPLPTMRSADSTRSHGHRPTVRPETPAAFVRLRIKPATAGPASLCELVIGGIVVRVSAGFDADELSRLLDVLHAR